MKVDTTMQNKKYIMKNLLIISTLLVTSLLIAQEQKENFKIEKGTWNVEGDISFNSNESEYLMNPSSSNNRDYWNFRISPKIGYAINDNLIFGLGVGYGYSKSEYEETSYNHSTNSYKVFPYIKKYIPVGKKIAVYIQGESQYGWAENKLENNLDYKSRSFFIGFRPGVSVNLSKNLLMQANIGSLGYSSYKTKRDGVDDQKSNSFAFDLSSSNLFFGLTLLL